MKKKLISIIFIGLITLASLNVVGNNTDIETEEDNTNETCNCSNSIDTRYSLGLIPDDPEDLPKSKTVTGDPPDEWNWRDVDGVDYTTPIRNQGLCESCYAFSAVAVMETKWNIKNGPNSNTDFSEQFIVSQGLEYGLMDGCCGGSMASTTKFLKYYGTVNEDDFEYVAWDSEGRTSGDCGFGDRPSHGDDPAVWNGGTRSRFKITDEYILLTYDNIKNAIVQYGPLVVHMDVFRDFIDYDGGVYTKEHGIKLGMHGLAVVGYKDTPNNPDYDGYWICKNSWGTEWGDNGWCYIAYDAAGIGPGGFMYYEDVIIGESISSPTARHNNISPLKIRILNFFSLIKNILAFFEKYLTISS